MSNFNGGSFKEVKNSEEKKVVVVSVKAYKEISKNAIVWALSNVVQPGDSIVLLVVIPNQTSGRKFWGFPRFSGDCASYHKRLTNMGITLEQKTEIQELCSKMMLQLHNINDPNKLNIKIKSVPNSPCGAVAAECKKVHANWVVLDKDLKNEEKKCMEELQCSIVVIKRSQPKILRLNLVKSPESEAQSNCPLPSELNLDKSSSKLSTEAIVAHHSSIKGPSVTPTSSPELETSFTTTEAGTSSVSSSDLSSSPFFAPDKNTSFRKKDLSLPIKENMNSDASCSDSDTEIDYQSWRTSSKRIDSLSRRFDDSVRISSAKALKDKFSKIDNQNVRDTVLQSRNAPCGPPPLCSICQHKSPTFGKPPRWFSYAELELATGGFSKANFLAEGGYGSVHRGVLNDGQAIAVKQHKLASSQGDHEFCSEVEVLSCAQHRNVVMLIGFCVEDRRRLLVYEYICNGSLDTHLYGRNKKALEWSARQKIAVGAARGLRYLHEECRVGCIVHRDMRPNNILITHDFEPLVGDFGLARWQPDGDKGVETRVIGTFGYLAPEYAQSGQITEKADVYSFGVVLIELVTGRKAIDINRPKGQLCLTEWARPLLEDYAVDELIDPRLGNYFSEQEVCCMLHAASLCIRRDPDERPKMSQVLRILEGDMFESNYFSTPSYEAGNRSGHLRSPSMHEVLRAAWEKEKETRSASFRR